MKHVEHYSGVGKLRWRDRTFDRVPYRIDRYQEMMPSGLPVPGVQRLEGLLELGRIAEAPQMVGSALTLALEDGRALTITLADERGRVLAEGHGPKHGCTCC